MDSVCILVLKFRVVRMIVAVPLVSLRQSHTFVVRRLSLYLTANTEAMKQQSGMDTRGTSDAIAKSTASMNEYRRGPYFDSMTTDRVRVTEAA